MKIMAVITETRTKSGLAFVDLTSEDMALLNDSKANAACDSVQATGDVAIRAY